MIASSRIFFSVFITLAVLTLAGNISIGQIAAQSATTIKLLEETTGYASIEFEMGAMRQQAVALPEGNAISVSIDEGTPMLVKGYPDLPKLTSGLIIPDDKNMAVTVTSANYTTYENILVAPSKGTLMRDVDPSDIPFVFDSMYAINDFFPKQIATLREPYILRDFRAQTIIVYPFQYNPVTKTLRVYSDVTITLTTTNEPATNALKRNPAADIKLNSAFSMLYEHRFINYQKDTRYDQLEEEGNMLIICHGPFMNAMQPFIDWKIQRGLPVEMVDVAAIGNNKTSIKNYVADYYNTKGLTYLLLVGDAAQVAASSTPAGDSDNNYGYIAGEDHYQEVFVGRFSAETESEVSIQVSKTIAYEKTPPADAYFSKGVCIASNEGAGIGDDGEADYVHQDLIRTQLLNYSYTDVAELFDGTQGNVDAPGNPVAADLSLLINNGTGQISYTGHGSGESLSTTDFSITDADNLNNTGKWPFIWVVGCSVGNFTGSTCLAEAFARSSHNGEAAGAVTSFMSTILQSWAEPMEAQDEITMILTESYSDNKKQTFGGLSINGCFSMNDEYGNTGYNMTDTWALFGDPSLEIRTAQPTAILATHDPSILLGATYFTVTCNTENVRACLSLNGNILSVVDVEGGLAELNFPQLTILDTLQLTITGYNKVPYIAFIPAMQPADALVINSGITLNDDSGNGNGIADFGESLLVDATLQNLGLSAAEDLTITLSTADPFVSITDATSNWPALASNNSIILPAAFAITVADNVPDGHTAFFNCNITDNALNTWNTPFSILMQAPVPAITTFLIDDNASGNGNGYLDPSETAMITLLVTNAGHSSADDITAALSTTNEFIVINTPSFNIGSLSAGESTNVDFEISIAPDATFGIDVPFTGEVVTGAYTGNLNFTALISPAIEDFESADFTTHDWQLSGTANWFITNVNPYEGELCATSGDINHNQSSAIEILLDVQFQDDLSFAHRVSSESGYDFLKFYIDGVLQDKWSGESDWKIAAYTIGSGEHAFRWEYAKDGYFSDGADAAWIDSIMLPAYEVNTATAVIPDFKQQSISAFPNPFNRFTQISYTLPHPSIVSVQLYTTQGLMIRQLLSNRKEHAGFHSFLFDGSDLPAGLYLCNIEIDGTTSTQQLIHIE